MTQKITIQLPRTPRPRSDRSTPRDGASRVTTGALICHYTGAVNEGAYSTATVDQAVAGWGWTEIQIYGDSVPVSGWAVLVFDREAGEPRFVPFSSGGLREIIFKVASFDSASRTALVDIVGWDDGFDWRDAPGLLGEPGNPLRVVEVYDYMGCIFDEPSSELFDRTGIARYMEYLDDANYEQGPKWIVTELCCKTATCTV